MKAESIYLGKYGWNVDVLFDVGCEDAEDTAGWIADMGADGRFVDIVTEKISACALNIGLAYSNLLTRETLVVIGKASSKEELLNTAAHENMHAAMHICEALGLDPYGEEPCYICGYLMGEESGSLLHGAC